VIIPPGPGVLCAQGDATTSVRDEASRTFIRSFSQTSAKEVGKIFRQLAADAAKTLDQEGIPRGDQSQTYQVDIRYHGQGLLLTVDFEIDDLEKRGLDVVGERFDEMHKQLFTFALPEEKEIVNLRAVAQGKATSVRALKVEKGGSDASAAVLSDHTLFVDGRDQKGKLYDRRKLKSGNVIKGPAVVLQMDTTTLILPGHIGRVDDFGNILITPE
jgi:N-methylhydantoinase A